MSAAAALPAAGDRRPAPPAATGSSGVTGAAQASTSRGNEAGSPPPRVVSPTRTRPPAGPGSSPPWRVGAAREDITPSDLTGVYLGGYGIGPQHPARGVLRHIFVRCLAVGDGDGGQVVLCALDLQGHFLAYQQGPYGFADIARDVQARLGIPADHVLLQSTHTHNGPDDLGVWGGVPDDYLALVVRQTERAIAEAVAGERPAWLRWATIDMGGFSHTFGPDSDPSHTGDRVDYPIDSTLRVLQATTPQGRVLATLVNYSTHATVYGPLDRVSPDWPGATATYLEGDEIGVPPTVTYGYPGSVAIVTVGAVGHSWPAPPPRGTDAAVDPPVGSDNSPADLYGNAVARMAMAALAAAHPVRGRHVGGATESIAVVNDNPLLLAAETAPLPGLHIMRANTPPYGIGDVIVTRVSGLRLGDLFLAGVPGEPYPTVEEATAEAVTAPLVIPLGLADDQLGYVAEVRDLSGAMQCSATDEGFFTISPTLGAQVEAALRRVARRLGMEVVSPPPLAPLDPGPVPPATACTTAQLPTSLPGPLPAAPSASVTR